MRRGIHVSSPNLQDLSFPPDGHTSLQKKWQHLLKGHNCGSNTGHNKSPQTLANPRGPSIESLSSSFPHTPSPKGLVHAPATTLLSLTPAPSPSRAASPHSGSFPKAPPPPTCLSAARAAAPTGLFCIYTPHIYGINESASSSTRLKYNFHLKKRREKKGSTHIFPQSTK